ncbi:MAG: septation protein SpoVG family protein [Planctomycetia bacterium]|nr:septation protein SpoVG family protein [Planctomycetia bacterium]
MDITEVRIKLMEDPQERLQAFCSITFDHCFVIRDLKIIEGAKGSFVAMPSRKLTDRCPRCNTKNQLRALYCNQCGVHLLDDRAGKDADGRAKLYADIAHPINSRCRELIQRKVMDAFHDEQVKARQPGYVCTYDDYGEDNFADLSELEPAQATFVSSSGAVHRIEPAHALGAAGDSVNAPHIAPAPERREPHSVAAGHGSDGDEGFGAGIG